MTDERITLTQPRWPLAGALVMSLVMGAGTLRLAIWFMGEGTRDGAARGIAMFIPATFLIILASWQAYELCWPRRIEINQDGLRLTRWKTVVAWSDLAPFKVVYQGLRFDWWLGRPVVVHRDLPPGRAFARWAVKPGVPPPSFFRTAGLLSAAYLRPRTVANGPVELVVVLETWRTKYADRS